MNFTLYPIYGLADEVDGEPFDLAALPFNVIPGVAIEFVGRAFRADAFDNMRERLGSMTVEQIQGVRYAVVHRYEPRPIVVLGEVLGEQLRNSESEQLVPNLAACLRLIRPMRQSALLVRGNVRSEDSTFNVTGFDIPPLYLMH